MDIYVSGQGKDEWSGSIPSPNPMKNDGPFKTLERAREKMRTLKKRGNLSERSVTVWLRGGHYYRETTFELTAEDSGTLDNPIIYRAYNNEKVHLLGGQEIEGFTQVTDSNVLDRLDESCRNKVMQVDLKAQGITNFASLKRGGMSDPSLPFEAAGMELFFQNKPMQLVKYPNEGWLTITGTPKGQHGGMFTSDDPRPKKWANLKNIWAHGYWTYDWADSYEKIETIDTSTGDIITEEPHGVYGYMVGKRFRYLNILEELDTPGEWYLDKNTGILYFYPPASLSQNKVLISLLKDPIITMNGSSHIRLQDLTLECTRGLGIKTIGGSYNTIVGCTLRNIGTTAVNIQGGKGHGVESCDLTYTGEGGVFMEGGDRKTLSPGEHYVVNNHFAYFDRRCTYRPAVAVRGVGNRIAHNLMHYARHTAIMLRGNDHLIEFNEIHDVCLETDDSGAFGMGRNVTERGNIIRYNYFHHMGPGGGVQSIYLDDCSGGMTIFGNIFLQGGRCIQIGGGRDNLVENNIFIDPSPAILIQARAKVNPSWKAYFYGKNPQQIQRLNEVPYKEPPWSERYPELVNILEDDPAFPKGNRIVRNIIVGYRWIDMVDGLTKKDMLLEDNMGMNTPNLHLKNAGDGTVIIKNNRIQLRENSPAFMLGFKRIPVEKIGLYQDEYRKNNAD